ncbi:hypothetical protein Q8F55_006784 [Vanrija albida]|uniref:UBC core domain-containing protein n=1 Tax=Vanrija albida TaxID=181172 RepID=A0ABR3PYX4_9TREE
MAESSASTASTPRPRPRVNLRSTAVKRIMQEASELSDPDTDDFVAAPLESDIFEWHCTLRGVKGTDYEGGLYHLRIILPPTYPMSAPDIVMLTPNGRFELGKKICIDGLTSFHAGSWQPAWGVRTAITGLRAFWTQDGEALSAIGALDQPADERRRLAKLSREWTCPTCAECNLAILPDVLPAAGGAGKSRQREDEVQEPAQSSSSSSSTANEVPAVLPAPGSAAAQRPPEERAPQQQAANPDPAPPAAQNVAQRPAHPAQPAAQRPAQPAAQHPAEQRPAHPATAPARPAAPAPGAHPAASTSNKPPIWLDAILAILIAVLLSLLARRT